MTVIRHTKEVLTRLHTLSLTVFILSHAEVMLCLLPLFGHIEVTPLSRRREKANFIPHSCTFHLRPVRLRHIQDLHRQPRRSSTLLQLLKDKQNKI